MATTQVHEHIPTREEKKIVYTSLDDTEELEPGFTPITTREDGEIESIVEKKGVPYFYIHKGKKNWAEVVKHKLSLDKWCLTKRRVERIAKRHKPTTYERGSLNKPQLPSKYSMEDAEIEIEYVEKKRQNKRRYPKRKQAKKVEKSLKARKKKVSKETTWHPNDATNGLDFEPNRCHFCRNKCEDDMCTECDRRVQIAVSFCKRRENRFFLGYLERDAVMDVCMFSQGVSEVLNTRRMVSHDGYDAFGPESDLFDFYILTDGPDGRGIYSYHRENWFRGDQEPYELMSITQESRDLNFRDRLESLFGGR